MTNGQIYKRFAVVTALTMIAVIVISIVMDTFFGLDAGSASGIVSLLVPAMDAGAVYVRNTGNLLENGRMWRLSATFFVINLCLGLIVFLGIFAISGAAFLEAFGQIGLVSVIIILGVMAAILIPITRFSLGFGARQAFKQLQK